jgi:hypothetical protein
MICLNSINRHLTRALVCGLILLFGSRLPAASAQLAPTDPYASENLIILDARINTKPARLLFDTGASFTALFAASTARLSLSSETNRSIKIAGHDVSVGLTPPLAIALLGKDANTRLPILPFPPAAECDGVLGWRTLGDSTFYIDAPGRRIRAVSELPATGWLRWPLDTESTQLFFTVATGGKPLGRVFVDTGSPIGLRISPQLWREWRKQNPQAGITLTTYRYAVGEPMVHELAWAKEYRLGDLLFHNVDIGPIPEAKGEQAVDASGKEFVATLGMGALRHVRMIVSPGTKEVLTQSVSPIPPYNRLGAVFIPVPNATTKAVALQITRLLQGTPASQAGLKEGDELVSINDVDFSPGSAGVATNPEQFLMQAAGTRLNIKVKRNGAAREFTIYLQDLLP